MHEVKVRVAGTISRQIVQVHAGRYSFRPEVNFSGWNDKNTWVELFFPENIWEGGSPGELWENLVVSSRKAYKTDKFGRPMVVTIVRPVRRVETAGFMYVDSYDRLIQMSQSGYSIIEKVIPTTRRIVTFEGARGMRFEYEEFRNNGVVIFRRQFGNPAPKNIPHELSSPKTTWNTNVVPFRR